MADRDADGVSIQTLIAQRDHARSEASRFAREAHELVDKVQRLCDHPADGIYEAPYVPAAWLSAQPPYRVCLRCGWAEEGWGCGWQLLRVAEPSYDRPERYRLTRDQAFAHVLGGVRSNDTARERRLELEAAGG